MPTLLQGTHKFCISRFARVAYGRAQDLLISVQPAQPLHVHGGLAEPVIVSQRARISAGCSPSASVARWRCSTANCISHARDAGQLNLYRAPPLKYGRKSSGSRESSAPEWSLYFHSRSAILKPNAFGDQVSFIAVSFHWHASACAATNLEAGTQNVCRTFLNCIQTCWRLVPVVPAILIEQPWRVPKAIWLSTP